MNIPIDASLERKPQIDVRRSLANLLSMDLDFHQDASNYASHALHAFAAKFPPQLPRVFIEGLTQRGETVMDPVMGSGTVIVEAFLCGRRAIGFDIDPLAPMKCRVKTHPVDLLEATWAGKRVVSPALVPEQPSEDETLMKPTRDFWIETTDRTHLYYRVTAASAEEARARFESGGGEYVGCNDECNEELHAVLEDKPSVAWN